MHHSYYYLALIVCWMAVTLSGMTTLAAPSPPFSDDRNDDGDVVDRLHSRDSFAADTYVRRGGSGAHRSFSGMTTTNAAPVSAAQYDRYFRRIPIGAVVVDEDGGDSGGRPRRPSSMANTDNGLRTHSEPPTVRRSSSRYPSHASYSSATATTATNNAIPVRRTQSTYVGGGGARDGGRPLLPPPPPMFENRPPKGQRAHKRRLR